MTNTTPMRLAIPDDVREFCATYELLGDLEIAIRVAYDTFAPFERWAASLQEDPDIENETYVIIDVWIRASVEQALRLHQAFVANWVDSSMTAEGKFRIRVLTNFA